ncbi:MAG: hypothetical protein WD039_08865 [Xanthobacteraceae bacterium]
MYWRLLNLGVIAALVLAAAYVYDIKYQSTLRVERAVKLQEDLRRERDAVAGLRAEWARLGNPRRIQTLADRHLTLAPVESGQFVDPASLPDRPPEIMQHAGDDPIGAMLDNSNDSAVFTGSIDPWRPEEARP